MSSRRFYSEPSINCCPHSIRPCQNFFNVPRVEQRPDNLRYAMDNLNKNNDSSPILYNALPIHSFRSMSNYIIPKYQEIKERSKLRNVYKMANSTKLQQIEQKIKNLERKNKELESVNIMFFNLYGKIFNGKQFRKNELFFHSENYLNFIRAAEHITGKSQNLLTSHDMEILNEERNINQKLFDGKLNGIYDEVSGILKKNEYSQSNRMEKIKGEMFKVEYLMDEFGKLQEKEKKLEKLFESTEKNTSPNYKSSALDELSRMQKESISDEDPYFLNKNRTKNNTSEIQSNKYSSPQNKSQKISLANSQKYSKISESKEIIKEKEDEKSESNKSKSKKSNSKSNSGSESKSSNNSESKSNSGSGSNSNSQSKSSSNSGSGSNS